MIFEIDSGMFFHFDKGDFILECQAMSYRMTETQAFELMLFLKSHFDEGIENE